MTNNKVFIIPSCIIFVSICYLVSKTQLPFVETSSQSSEIYLQVKVPNIPVCKTVTEFSSITEPLKSFETCIFNDTSITIPPPEDTPPWSYDKLYNYFESYNFQQDGMYFPNNCKPSSINAIIVCYRNRDQHLRYFLEHTIKTLIHQKSAFKIYLVEPPQNTTFNRAKLFNVGFTEAIKDKGNGFFNCVTFHDVDLMQMSKNKIVLNHKNLSISFHFSTFDENSAL